MFPAQVGMNRASLVTRSDASRVPPSARGPINSQPWSDSAISLPYGGMSYDGKLRTKVTPP